MRDTSLALIKEVADKALGTSTQPQSLTDGAAGALGGDSPYAMLLPDALTDGVMSGGGLGLARQLADAIEPPASNAPGARA